MTSTTKLALRATALAAFTMVSASAFADFDANLELDSTYLNQDRGLKQSGRVEVNASKKVGSSYFMAGRATLLAQKSGNAATDDMWGQFGNDMADIKLGRFEATDLGPNPQDTIVNHATGNALNAGFSPYRGNELRGRMGSDIFHGAVTLKMGGGLGLEVGVVSSKNAGAATGVRPVLTYANGPLSLAAGFESIKYRGAAATAATQTVGIVGGVISIINTPATAATGDVTRHGFGMTGTYDFGGFKLTGNFASGKTRGGQKDRGYGLIAQAGPAALGVLMGTREAAVAGVDDLKVTTVYASYVIPFFDIKGASITPAISLSKGGGSNNVDNDNGFRVRVNYTF